MGIQDNCEVLVTTAPRLFGSGTVCRDPPVDEYIEAFTTIEPDDAASEALAEHIIAHERTDLKSHFLGSVDTRLPEAKYAG